MTNRRYELVLDLIYHETLGNPAQLTANLHPRLHEVIAWRFRGPIEKLENADGAILDHDRETESGRKA